MNTQKQNCPDFKYNPEVNALYYKIKVQKRNLFAVMLYCITMREVFYKYNKFTELTDKIKLLENHNFNFDYDKAVPLFNELHKEIYELTILYFKETYGLILDLPFNMDFNTLSYSLIEPKLDIKE